MKEKLPCMVGLALALVACGFSGVLLKLHSEGKPDLGLLARICGEEGAGCDKVIQSRWAVFPPGPKPEVPVSEEEAEPDEQPVAEAGAGGGVPVAALGLFYFTAMACWFLVHLILSRPVIISRMLVAIVGVGAICSVGFIVLMAGVVGAWCPLCLGAHGANFVLFAVLIVFYRRTRSEAPQLRAKSTSPKPAWCLTALLAATAATAEWMSYRAAALGASTRRLSEAMRSIQEDVDALEMIYFSQQKVGLDIRDKSNRRNVAPADYDPIIDASPGTRNTVVVFSDIECPHCGHFIQKLFDEIKPMYNGHLRIVYKHFPITKRHPHAYRGAQAMEAARMQGRFWPMHDYLLERRTGLKDLDYAAAARELGLNVEQFLADMESEKAARR
ncbi:MAG: vitamin K epoxide reductase family protein, partial [Verrucomicrobiota bacterium]